jgi:hypothetical protein
MRPLWLKTGRVVLMAFKPPGTKCRLFPRNRTSLPRNCYTPPLLNIASGKKRAQQPYVVPGMRFEPGTEADADGEGRSQPYR